MAKRLTKLTVNEVSAVDKGANNKKFLVLKRATDEEGAMFGRSKKADEGPTDGGTDMTADEIRKVVTEAAEEVLDPIMKRIDDLEEFVYFSESEEEATEGVAKSGDEDQNHDDLAELIAEAVGRAVQPLDDRLASLEQVRGVRKSATADGNGAGESQSMWAGIF